MAFLTMEQVTYSYQAASPVVRGIELRIEKGMFCSLLGKSGCGKTTLLKLAAGFLQPNSGVITLNGAIVTEPSDECGFVFQSPALLEWKTVIDNVLLPLRLKRKLTKADRAHAAGLLNMVGLSAHHDRYPAQLSGGQQSRVAIARALVKNPSMLFLDEPFAALDAITREELQQDLLAICRAQHTTVLFITHDIAEAVYLSDRVLVMDSGQFTAEKTVDLLKPREAAMRYSPYFNELCSALRRAMIGDLK